MFSSSMCEGVQESFGKEAHDLKKAVEKEDQEDQKTGAGKSGCSNLLTCAHNHAALAPTHFCVLLHKLEDI